MDDRTREGLREIDARLGEVALPAGLGGRIARTAAARSNRRQVVGVLVAATAAVVVAFLLGRVGGGRSNATTATATATTTATTTPTTTTTTTTTATTTDARGSWWGGQLEAETGCAIEALVEGEIVVRGDCRLRLDAPGMSIDVWDGARLGRTEHGVRLHDGVALFHADPVPEGRPRTRVEVAAGAIEVIGTRFVVEQRAGAGHVDLLEGAIAFVDVRGMTIDVAPGQRLDWGAAEVPVSAPRDRPRARRPRGASPAAPAIDAALDEVAALRRAGRHRDAVALLVRVRRGVDDAAVEEVLSFEEGTLRMHTDLPVAVCGFWRGHLARFGEGAYGRSIAEHMASAGCEEH